MSGSARWSWSFAVLILSTMALSSGQYASSGAPLGAPMDVNLFRRIARDHKAIVVAITTRTRVEAPSTEDVEWFERFFNRSVPRTPHIERQIGSGFLISRDGDVLTTNHVVAQADSIEVRLSADHTMTYRARVVGTDPISDSAVLRLDGAPADLPFATLGDSDALETGDWVMAIGNPFKLAHSVTVGVVSGERRAFEVEEGRWQTLIQVDASINPGNSGGPLINVRGEVVGITKATLEDGIGASIGIGFAVPINSVKAVLPQLRAGRVRRGHLGVSLRHGPLTGDDAEALGLARAAGALITSVDRGSTADRAGLHAGDVVVDVAGSPVLDADDLFARVSATTPGSRPRLTVTRDGRTRTLEIEVETLAAVPAVPRPRDGEPADFGLTLADAIAPASTPARPSVAAGALVQSVEDEGPAAQAGLEKGDVVRKVNRHVVKNAAEAMREFERIQTGRPAFLLVWRDGHETLLEMHQD